MNQFRIDCYLILRGHTFLVDFHRSIRLRSLTKKFLRILVGITPFHRILKHDIFNTFNLYLSICFNLTVVLISTCCIIIDRKIHIHIHIDIYWRRLCRIWCNIHTILFFLRKPNTLFYQFLGIKIQLLFKIHKIMDLFSTNSGHLFISLYNTITSSSTRLSFAVEHLSSW